VPEDRPRIVWCSPTYGYGDDLMYFGPLFAAFWKRFPGTVVPVRRTFPVRNHPDVPLLPLLAFHAPRRLFSRRATTGYVWRRLIPTVPTLIRLLRLPADLHVLIEFTPLATAGFVVARIRRSRTLLLVESDPRLRGTRTTSWEVAIKRFIARRADHVMVSNDEGAAYLRDVLRVPDSRVTVAPYLTSAPPGDCVRRSPTPVRGTRRGAVRFLFLGSVSPLKGVDHLVAALSDLGDDCTGRWTLDIVGDGGALDAVRRQVDRAGLNHVITFHHAVPYAAIWRYYRDADVVVNPTLADYRSLASFEAVNAGRPAVLSCYDGAAPELVRSGAQVQVVRPDDRGELSRALRRYVVDETFLAAARRAAETPPPRFTLAAVVDNLETAARAALAGGAAGVVTGPGGTRSGGGRRRLSAPRSSP
jgi:glycosyltransferase involved in cell wall biosynthesis